MYNDDFQRERQDRETAKQEYDRARAMMRHEIDELRSQLRDKQVKVHSKKESRQPNQSSRPHGHRKDRGEKWEGELRQWEKKSQDWEEEKAQMLVQIRAYKREGDAIKSALAQEKEKVASLQQQLTGKQQPDTKRDLTVCCTV